MARSLTACQRMMPRSTLKPSRGTTALMRTSRQSISQACTFQKFTLALLYSESQVGLVVGTQVKKCVNKANDSAALCSAVIRHRCWISKWFYLFCQCCHEYPAWHWQWHLFLPLPSGQTPQSPSSSHQHHLTSPTMKPSTSYFSSWYSALEQLWNQGHT